VVEGLPRSDREVRKHLKKIGAEAGADKAFFGRAKTWTAEFEGAAAKRRKQKTRRLAGSCGRHSGSAQCVKLTTTTLHREEP
jgi:hypothetical protein